MIEAPIPRIIQPVIDIPINRPTAIAYCKGRRLIKTAVYKRRRVITAPISRIIQPVIDIPIKGPTAFDHRKRKHLNKPAVCNKRPLIEAPIPRIVQPIIDIPNNEPTMDETEAQPANVEGESDIDEKYDISASLAIFSVEEDARNATFLSGIGSSTTMIKPASCMFSIINTYSYLHCNYC